jgi:hypothetical protein
MEKRSEEAAHSPDDARRQLVTAGILSADASCDQLDNRD